MAEAALVFGAVAALLAGAGAFLITYHEMAKHFPGSPRPRRMAIRDAAVTAVVFLALGGVLALALPAIFGHG